MDSNTVQKQHQALIANLAQQYQRAGQNAARPMKGHVLWRRIFERFSWRRKEETFEQGMRKASLWMDVSFALSLLAALLSAVSLFLVTLSVHANGSNHECVQARTAVPTVGQCVSARSYKERN